MSRLALLDSGRGEFTRDLRGWFRSFLESQTTAVLTQLVKASGQALFPSAGKPPAGKCTRSVGFLLEHNQQVIQWLNAELHEHQVGRRGAGAPAAVSPLPARKKS